MRRKKKLIKYFTFLLVLALVLWYLRTSDLSLGDLTKEQTPNTESQVQDHGQIELYFCPQDACADQMVRAINLAQSTLHCAVYELDHPKIQEAIREKSAKIQVQIVTDNDYLKEFNESYVKTDRSGLMHNKFCIIDNQIITAGSMNPTINDAEKNNNNFFIINSTILAQNYEAEFNEMWTGTFKKGGAVANPEVYINNITLENYFCPDDHCANQVIKELKTAKESIHFMVFSFTHDDIANTLLLKKQDGLSIHGVFETRQESEYSEYVRLKYQDTDVLLDGNKYTMHHKVFIIDEITVVTGSFNPSAGGDTRNDENILIIHDKSIAQRFMQEFDKVYNEAALKNEAE